MREKYRFKLREKWWGKSFYMPAAVYNEHIYIIVMYMRERNKNTTKIYIQYILTSENFNFSVLYMTLNEAVVLDLDSLELIPSLPYTIFIIKQTTKHN